MKKEQEILILSPLPQSSGGVSTYVNALKNNWNLPERYLFRGNAGKGKLKKIANTGSKYLKFIWINITQPRVKNMFINTSMDRKAFQRDRIFIAIAKLFGKKTNVFIHGWDQKFFDSIDQKKLRMFFKADKIFVLSNAFKKSLKESGYFKKIVVETTVVEKEFMQRFPTFSIPRKKETGFLYLARLEEEKGILLLIEAFQQLSLLYKNITLDIAGFGSMETEVRKRISASGNPAIQFHGLVKDDAKARLFKTNHVFVLPTSHGEGMPISILEAMAAGLTVITTEAGALKDFFVPGQMGYQMKAATIDALKKEMEAAICGDNTSEIGKKNFHYAREHFTVKNVISRLEKEILYP